MGGTIAHSFGGGGHPKAAGSVFDGRGMRGLIIQSLFFKQEEERKRIVEALCNAGEEYIISAEDLEKALKQ